MRARWPGWRRWLRAQSTLLAWSGLPGFRSYGYYVPQSHAGAGRALGEDESVPWLEARMEGESERYLDHLEAATAHRERFASFASERPGRPGEPRFDQDWFPGIDAAMAYAMVHRYRPRRIVEIGSGHSTRFMAQAIRDAGIDTELHSIDPEPRREIDSLCARITRALVTEADAGVFASLAPGDFLFLDGSHVALPGGDVDHLFRSVLPTLADGVLVHVHDVFLPWGYPAGWPFSDYSEQYLLLAALGGGERYEILAPSAWLRRRYPEAVGRLGLALVDGAREGSFWMRVRGE